MTFRRIAIVLFFLPMSLVNGQELLKLRPSPLAIASVRYQDNYLKVTYSQPQKKNRKIFGGLVPYGKVWRTGANEATELTTTRDIHIADLLLKAGTYSLFTVPEKEKWTIIINADLGLWGAYNYNATKDVWRFDVPVQSTDKVYEAFTINIENRNEVAELLIMWDDVKVSVPIKFLK